MKKTYHRPRIASHEGVRFETAVSETSVTAPVPTSLQIALERAINDFDHDHGLPLSFPSVGL